MKKLTILLITVFIYNVLSSQKPSMFEADLEQEIHFQPSKKGFEINGEITNADNKTIYLQHTYKSGRNTHINTVDSCIVNNGHFLFKGHVKETEHYYIAINSKEIKKIILKNTKLSFKSEGESISNAEISGSKDNIIADSMNRALLPLQKNLNEINKDAYRAYLNGDNKKENELTKKIKSIKAEILLMKIDLIQTYPDCFESLFLLSEIYGIDLLYYKKENLVFQLFYSLSDDLQQHSIGKKIHADLNIIEKLYSEPMSFALPDSNGTMIDLDIYRGNYTLVEFWASWCSPCREENPNLKYVHEKYKDKGFNIISVSVDESKERWLKAVKNDELNWNNVYNSPKLGNDVFKRYGLKAVPSNFLLDKDGMVIAKNIKGEELREKLAEIFE